MYITQAADILRSHYRIILATLLATVLTTLLVSLILPKSFEATSTIVLNYKGTDPVTGHTLPAQLVPGFMATQVDVIKSDSVARRVVDQLRLADSAALDRRYAGLSRDDVAQRLARSLSSRVDVEPSHESSVVEVSVADSDPRAAAQLANAFVAAYQQVSLQLKVDPLRKASTYFDEQIKKLHSNYEKAQQRLATYQRDKGIVSADRQYDIETTRLNELSSQLATVQLQRNEAELRLRHASSTGAGVAPEVIGNPLIHSLANALAVAESRFADLGQKLGPAHPQYLSAKSEVDRLRDSLATNKQAILSSLSNNVSVLRQREADLRSALDRQTSRILELNFARGELAVLTRDAEHAQRVYESAAQRFAQINLEGKSDLSDIAVLSVAETPAVPASPRIARNTLFSLAIGLMLGCGFAVLIEMNDRTIRLSADLANVLQAPVLGTVQWRRMKARSDSPPIRFWPSGLRLSGH